MSPKRRYKLVENLTFDIGSGRYRFRNPITGKRTWVGRDKIEAISRAEIANKAIALEKKIKLKRDGVITMDYVIRLYIELVVPGKPWEDSTRGNHLAALELYAREFGEYLFSAVDRIFLADWINDRCTTFDCRSKHRSRLVDLYKFAISRGLTDANEADAVYQGSGSIKLAANRKVRKRLTSEQFQLIHAKAPPFLQIAMELSLVTLQARRECVDALHSNVRNGELFVVRKKTAGDSDMAFIRIPMTDQIEQILSKSRKSGIASPHIVHMRPQSMRPQHLQNKAHWSSVTPDYLSKAFAKARTAAGVGADLAARQRPSFHEIRSLGGRTYRELGYSKEYIQALMTHSDEKVTEIYLNNPDEIKPEHYKRVSAELKLSDL